MWDETIRIDPCLFIGKRIITILWIDDLLFWSQDKKHIHNLAIKLWETGVDLDQEDSAAGFLGVQLKKNKSGHIETRETGLIDRIIEA